jgi:hypothetical protein
MANVNVRGNKGQVAVGDGNEQNQTGGDGNGFWIILTAIAGVVAAVAGVLVIVLT